MQNEQEVIVNDAAEAGTPRIEEFESTARAAENTSLGTYTGTISIIEEE